MQPKNVLMVLNFIMVLNQAVLLEGFIKALIKYVNLYQRLIKASFSENSQFILVCFDFMKVYACTKGQFMVQSFFDRCEIVLYFGKCDVFLLMGGLT